MSDFSRLMADISRSLANAPGAPGSPMAKALPAATEPSATTISGKDFMARAMEASKAGRITSTQLAECEQAVGTGQRPRDRLVKAVMTDTSYDDVDEGWG